MNQVERLINYYDIDPVNISFGEAQMKNVPETDITYKRIPISIEHNDGTFGPLIIKTQKCFSFGAQQNINKETGVLNGWTLPIVMYDRDKPTADQLDWVKKFDEIVERCRDFLIHLYDFEKEQLDKIGGCMWWSKNDPSRGPTLYPKIICGKLNKRYDTKFRMVRDLYGKGTGVAITKEELIDNYNVIAAIRIDSIYIGNENISIQVKVYEALVEELEELPSLLRPVTVKAHTQRPTLLKD